MAELQLHLDGSPADHAEWTTVDTDDDFDAAALERALVAERSALYAELRETSAA